MLSRTEIKGEISSLKQRALSYIFANKGIMPIIRKLAKKYELAILSNNSKEWGQGIVKKYGLKNTAYGLDFDLDRNQNINRPASISPNLRSSRFFMDVRVCWIAELL